eukprot:CCRYP_018583-RA/>CCRYP_018583-RA protein AED:0.04 eAED:0.04 QI:281/1/1/1/0/0/2/428/178
MDRFIEPKRGALSDSVTTNSSSTRQAHPRTSLDEEYQLLAEQVVQLKMEIATWKATQDERNLDRKHTNSGRDILREELAHIEAECTTYRNETKRTLQETAHTMHKLQHLRLDVAREEEEALPVRTEHDSLQAELNAAQEELSQVKAAQEALRKEIDELENEKARVSSKRSKLDLGLDY